MKRKIAVMAIILFLLILTGILITSRDKESNESDGSIVSFHSNLEHDGFYVQEGRFELVDVIKLCNEGLAKVCNGNNAGNPYYSYVLPLAPTQTIPNEIPYLDGYLNYRLAPDEAIVFIGHTPPEMMFFSYRSFLYSRYYDDFDRQKKLFASLGDTINKLTVSTKATPYGAVGDPFNQPIIIITTADRKINERIRNAAITAGYPAEIINTDILPFYMLNMGLDNESDTFIFLARTAMFIDTDACNAYVKNSGGRVFRVTPMVSGVLDPYPTPALKPRGTGITEHWLSDAVEDLRQAILNYYSDYESTELKTEIWLPETFVGIEERIDVIGESRDTPYLWTNGEIRDTPYHKTKHSSAFTLSDDPDEFLIVYGVNHQATGKATYSNFTVYGEKYINGVASVASPSFPGSAEVYIPGHPEADFLYAWKVARSSDDSDYCLTVPYGPLRYGFGVDADDQYGYVGFRAYLEPETTVGAKWNELIYDRVIKFK